MAAIFLYHFLRKPTYWCSKYETHDQMDFLKYRAPLKKLTHWTLNSHLHTHTPPLLGESLNLWYKWTCLRSDCKYLFQRCTYSWWTHLSILSQSLRVSYCPVNALCKYFFYMAVHRYSCRVSCRRHKNNNLCTLYSTRPSVNLWARTIKKNGTYIHYFVEPCRPLPPARSVARGLQYRVEDYPTQPIRWRVKGRCFRGNSKSPKMMPDHTERDCCAKIRALRRGGRVGMLPGWLAGWRDVAE